MFWMHEKSQQIHGKPQEKEILELKIISQGSEKLTGWFSQMGEKEE